MFQLITATIMQIALLNPVDYLEGHGFEHVIVEGTSFTAQDGELWCEGRVLGAAHAYVCTNDVVPKCDGFEHASCEERAVRQSRNDMQSAIATMERSCVNGNTHACQGFRSADTSLEQHLDQAPGMWMGCGRKHGDSCANLANLALRKGAEETALAMMKRACDYGSRGACQVIDQHAADAVANKIAAR